MSKLAVRNWKGETVGEVEWPDDRLVLDRGDQAVRDAVVAHAAALRAGTANTRGKGEVAGSNRKPWRQKGTGRARAGYRQSPLWRGGGVAHGPHPRSHAARLPRKVVRLAVARAWSSRVADGEVVVLEAVDLPDPKTRHVAALQKALGADGGLLVLTDRPDRRLAMAARNLPRVAVATASEVDVTTILRYPRIAATRAALEVMAARVFAAGGAE